jgi:hypothetical protein
VLSSSASSKKVSGLEEPAQAFQDLATISYSFTLLTFFVDDTVIISKGFAARKDFFLLTKRLIYGILRWSNSHSA